MKMMRHNSKALRIYVFMVHHCYRRKFAPLATAVFRNPDLNRWLILSGQIP